MQNNSNSFWSRYSVTLKAFLIFILAMLLLIPASMIRGLIYEREERQQEAVDEISSKWSTAQTLTGPILTIPFTESVKSNNVVTKVKRNMYFLPETLNINGDIITHPKNRGIFEVILYETKLQIKGSFANPDFSQFNINEGSILLNAASINIGLSDLKGISNFAKLNWNDQELIFEPSVSSTDILETGISVPVNLSSDKTKYTFTIEIDLKGSQNFFCVPVGKSTYVNLKSKWQTPKFTGNFLPIDNTGEVTQKGFDAKWKVLHLNRNFPQAWIGDRYNFDDSKFGLELLMPVGNYQKSERTAKYAILFIGLTFLTFFFVELIRGSSIHPFQYILVGLALVVFYTLLLSFSEHLGFNTAYLVSAMATILLISLYCLSIFKTKSISFIISGLLCVLYLFVFVLIQLEDYALLTGSIGLFIILALTMFYSRKIDWYALSKNAND